jgi:pimeloyl-ACP methyl ester carboxylesterase
MEAKHNSMDFLGHIADPVLLIGSDRDLTLSKELQKETSAAIPGAKLILYEGRGHGEVHNHKRFVQDVLEFLR